MECLNKVRDALLTVSENVGHYEVLEKKDQYIVWAEDSGGNRLSGDNMLLGQAIQGQVHYYTRMENDPNVDEIPNALNGAKISFYLEAVQYEDETKYIHYTWVFEVS